MSVIKRVFLIGLAVEVSIHSFQLLKEMNTNWVRQPESAQVAETRCSPSIDIFISND